MYARMACISIMPHSCFNQFSHSVESLSPCLADSPIDKRLATGIIDAAGHWCDAVISGGLRGYSIRGQRFVLVSMDALEGALVGERDGRAYDVRDGAALTVAESKALKSADGVSSFLAPALTVASKLPAVRKIVWALEAGARHVGEGLACVDALAHAVQQAAADHVNHHFPGLTSKLGPFTSLAVWISGAPTTAYEAKQWQGRDPTGDNDAGRQPAKRAKSGGAGKLGNLLRRYLMIHRDRNDAGKASALLFSVVMTDSTCAPFTFEPPTQDATLPSASQIFRGQARPC